MSRLSCSETFRRLDDYLDRELGTDELAAVEAHLADCGTCAGEFSVEREVLELLKAKLRRLKAPGGLMARIAARFGT